MVSTGLYGLYTTQPIGLLSVLLAEHSQGETIAWCKQLNTSGCEPNFIVCYPFSVQKRMDSRMVGFVYPHITYLTGWGYGVPVLSRQGHGANHSLSYNAEVKNGLASSA